MKTKKQDSVNGTSVANNETKVVCPNCGAEFGIPEQTSIGIGIFIGKDAGLGTIHPKVVGQDKPAEESKLPKKAADRIEALKAAGVDVSGFFSMVGAEGGEFVCRMEDGKIDFLSDDDPIYDAILEQGDVYNPKLARRWIMSQIFHLLAQEGNIHWGSRVNSITAQIRNKGYEYQWKMIEHELNAQAKMYRHRDMENFEDRNFWFNKTVVAIMMKDYLTQLTRFIAERKVKHCNKVPYKNFCGKNEYLHAIEPNVYRPVEKIIEKVRRTDNPCELCSLVREFNGIRLNRGWEPQQCAAWLDAYKGAGGFFTLQNLIRYHKCGFFKDGKKMGKKESYKVLKNYNNEYNGEGWRMIGLLRQFLEDNGIDINKKMAEWRKRK